MEKQNKKKVEFCSNCWNMYLNMFLKLKKKMNENIDNFDITTSKIQSSLIYLINESCLNDNFKAKFIKEVNEYLPIVLKYAQTDQNQDYFYVQAAQRLSDISRRIYLSALEKNKIAKNEKVQNTLSSLEDSMLYLYQEIDQQIDFSEDF